MFPQLLSPRSFPVLDSSPNFRNQALMPPQTGGSGRRPPLRWRAQSSHIIHCYCVSARQKSARVTTDHRPPIRGRRRVSLPTCFCSSFSPLIASSTGNSELGRWVIRPARDCSGGRILQLATRRPSNQAAVAISALPLEREPRQLRASPASSTNPRLRCLHPIGEGVGLRQPIILS